MQVVMEFIAHILGQLLVQKVADETEKNSRSIALPVVFAVIVGVVIFFVWLIYFLTH
ncbi:MAG: hypothetical protein J6M43_07760 [Neisseriaceae bacterium]|nr:hypothetical protein [Neisseriaceae bacterium]